MVDCSPAQGKRRAWGFDQGSLVPGPWAVSCRGAGNVAVPSTVSNWLEKPWSGPDCTGPGYAAAVSAAVPLTPGPTPRQRLLRQRWSAGSLWLEGVAGRMHAVSTGEAEKIWGRCGHFRQGPRGLCRTAAGTTIAGARKGCPEICAALHTHLLALLMCSKSGGQELSQGVYSPAQGGGEQEAFARAVRRPVGRRQGSVGWSDR